MADKPKDYDPHRDGVYGTRYGATMGEVEAKLLSDVRAALSYDAPDPVGLARAISDAIDGKLLIMMHNMASQLMGSGE